MAKIVKQQAKINAPPDINDDKKGQIKPPL